MIKAFFTGRTGAAAHQHKLDIAANNMANANTVGFRSSNASFQELLHQRVRMPDDYELRPGLYEARNRHNTRNWNRGAPPQVFDAAGEPVFTHYPGNVFTENRLRVGTGARLGENALVMTQGSLMLTNDFLTVGLANPRAFFAVLGPNEEILYTRSGAFALSTEEDGLFLVTGSGEYVLGENLEPIRLPDTITSMEELIIAPHNHPDPEEYNALVIRVGIFTFENLYGLAKVGGNNFMPTEFSGEAEIFWEPGDDIIRQGYLEASNVHIANEMIRVIQAQRAFQSNLASVRTADEIAAYINQLNG